MKDAILTIPQRIRPGPAMRTIYAERNSVSKGFNSVLPAAACVPGRKTHKTLGSAGEHRGVAVMDSRNMAGQMRQDSALLQDGQETFSRVKARLQNRHPGSAGRM